LLEKFVVDLLAVSEKRPRVVDIGPHEYLDILEFNVDKHLVEIVR
jgi:hypothetical protein